MEEDLRKQIEELENRVRELEQKRIHQSDIIPASVRENHIYLGERAQGDIIYVDSSDRLSLLNAGTSGGALITGGADADPAWSTPDTGWAITNKTSDKTLDCNVGDVNVVADVLGTLVDVLISIGIISA